MGRREFILGGAAHRGGCEPAMKQVRGPNERSRDSRPYSIFNSPLSRIAEFTRCWNSKGSSEVTPWSGVVALGSAGEALNAYATFNDLGRGTLKPMGVAARNGTSGLRLRLRGAEYQYKDRQRFRLVSL